MRQHLTLCISDPTHSIEKIRSSFNPEQFRLVAAHVTFCREDEIVAMHKIVHKIVHKIRSIRIDCPLNIKFFGAERFSDEAGVLMRAQGSQDFQELRWNILRGSGKTIHRHDTHITLIHPRNSSCTDEIFGKIESYRLPPKLMFEEVSLIKQINGGVWQVVEKFRICD